MGIGVVEKEPDRRQSGCRRNLGKKFSRAQVVAADF
jgi:hypothetical protein